MTENICGYEKDDGEPCQRPAGWGFPDSQMGHCKDHAWPHQVPRKLTDEVQQTIIGAVRRGAWDWMAADLAGIHPDTLSRWKSWAEDALELGIENELTEFYAAYRRAHAAGGVERLGEVDPEWLLERKYGYTKEQDINLGGQKNNPVQIEFAEEVVETEWGESE